MLEKLSEVNFKIQLGPDGQTKVIHHNKLKPYEGKGVPRWVNKVVTRLRGGGQHKAGEAEKEYVIVANYPPPRRPPMHFVTLSFKHQF